MLEKIAVKMERSKEKRLAKRKLEDGARRYIAIKNAIRRYEKDGSEYSLNHIKKLEKRMETIKDDIKYWNNRLETVKQK